MATTTITGYEKKGPMLIYFTNDVKGRCYRIDFEKGKIYGLTGKPLETSYSLMSKIPENENNIFYQVLSLLTNIDKLSFSVKLKYYQAVESLLSYPDLWNNGFSFIDHSMIYLLIETCEGKIPNGYVKWCRDNNKFFHSTSLAEFLEYIKIAQWPESLIKEVQQFNNGTTFNLLRATDYNQDLTRLLLKLTRNSLKRYETMSLINNCFNICEMLKDNPELREDIDDTKSLSVVLSILRARKDEKRNIKILQNEMKIACLHGIIVGNDFIINVPNTMDDFQNEGEQQHNCVGYYYHDSIAKGVNLIYFLRKKSMPDKSYITCRFSLAYGKTVECRLKNNISFEDSKLFKEIDALIKEALINLTINN